MKHGERIDDFLHPFHMYCMSALILTTIHILFYSNLVLVTDLIINVSDIGHGSVKSRCNGVFQVISKQIKLDKSVNHMRINI